MKLDDLNSMAFFGTAENLIRLLLAFGHDEDAVDYIQKGVNGVYYHYTFRTPEDWDRELLPFSYNGEVAEKAAKDDIMASFYAQQGVFAPAPSKETTAGKFNDQAQRIAALEKTVAEQAKTIETLKKNPPENPSIRPGD